MCVGTNPGDSAKNFRKFMDELVEKYGGPASFVFKLTGERIEGVFHRLQQQQHSTIEGAITSLSLLQSAITQKGVATHSAGTYLSIAGAGKGNCEIVHKKLGPFQS